MRVLVTGATGFVGGNLARELKRRDYDVLALVRPGSNTLAIDGTGIRQIPGDILDRESLDRAVQGCEGSSTAPLPTLFGLPTRDWCTGPMWRVRPTFWERR
jgi:dihydroflavonol-4-reductase